MNFYLVDVFAEKKYQGNQLAVLIAQEKLSTADMQNIAQEINFSETSFITSNKNADGGYNVRIFTPDLEIPFAGHPTLGTAFIISQLLEKKENKQVILNLKIGQIPVTFMPDDHSELWMEQKQPSFGALIQPKEIAEILSIHETDININFPIQVVSTGLPAVIIPLKSLDAVKKCLIRHEKYKTFLDKVITANLLVFAPETQKPENNLHVRVFMDDHGFFEDPATGSANGNLAAYLLEHLFFQTSKINLRVEQGYEMQRPSLIKIKAEKDKNRFHIHVGGKVLLIANGNWA
jgi:trans-2,3-dihydro-3-hydroxyanthranilate isomerase